MNAASASAGGKAPAWVADLRRELTSALKRIEVVEEERASQLRVIAELQRQYQDLVRATALAEATAASGAHDAETLALINTLEKLTIKRHAVLTATLAGVGYQEIAAITGWDVTTVKLQLRAALQVLGIPNREALLVQHKRILDRIPDKDYQRRYGLSKRWWLEKNDDLMQVLRATKATANQHTGPRRRDEDR